MIFSFFYFIFSKGESHLSRALELARNKMFSKDWGVRANTLSIMLLITDGTESSATAVDHQALDYIKALNQSGLLNFSFSHNYLLFNQSGLTVYLFLNISQLQNAVSEAN